MSSQANVSLLLARMGDDVIPCVVAAVDHRISEHWDDEEDAAWLQRGKETWGDTYDTEFKVVIAAFSEQALAEAFATPVIRGDIA